MKYGILGGDFRNIELAKLLAKDENILYTYGLEKELYQKQEYKNILICNNIKELEKAQVIITAMPLSKDGVNLNMPLYDEKIKINDILKIMGKKLVFSGNLSKETLNRFSSFNIDVVDIMKIEEFAILNAIPTAEETIKIIIENMKKMIHNTKCLIMGYGRIGKVLAKKLSGLSVNVTCLVSNDIEKTWCEVDGYSWIEFKNIKDNNIILKKYDIIINTIPRIILTHELSEVQKDTLVIDLASKPYGIDRKVVKKEKLNFIEALGLPGKSAPITVAENMKKIIDNVLSEKNVN